jgi:hypothetical protein
MSHAKKSALTYYQKYQNIDCGSSAYFNFISIKKKEKNFCLVVLLALENIGIKIRV